MEMESGLTPAARGLSVATCSETVALAFAGSSPFFKTSFRQEYTWCLEALRLCCSTQSFPSLWAAAGAASIQR